MENTFFDFNALPREEYDEVDNGPELEEEYDALNSETFGAEALDDDDWEEDHKRYVEDSDKSCNQETLNDIYTAQCKLLDMIDNDDYEEKLFELSNKSRHWETPLPSAFKKIQSTNVNNQAPDAGKIKENSYASQQLIPPQLPRVTLPKTFKTVEELERDLILKTNIGKEELSTQAQHNQQASQSNNIRNSKHPPGFGPIQIQGPFPMPPPPQGMILMQNSNMTRMVVPPNFLVRPPPRPIMMVPASSTPPPSRQIMMVPSSSTPMMRVMPSRPILIPHQPQQQNVFHQHELQLRQVAQDKNRFNQTSAEFTQTSPNSSPSSSHPRNSSIHQPISPSSSSSSNYPQSSPSSTRSSSTLQSSSPGSTSQSSFSNQRRRSDDEYAGLMNNRERQWLLNIQILQLSSTQPHIDDYYYTNWLRKEEAQQKKEEASIAIKPRRDRDPFFMNNRQIENDSNRERKDSERDLTPTPSPRVYVPLQFENSLGKLQCGSVTAPRKIIDTDVVSEPQSEASQTNPRDSRKTKYILLELEQCYLYILAIEELLNQPTNTIDLVSNDPDPDVILIKTELVNKILISFINDEKFVYFTCIRKGKALLLRLFSLLGQEHQEQLFQIWQLLIKFVSIIIRKDVHDNLLMRFLPFFNNWVKKASFSQLFSLSSLLLPSNNQNINKTSPRAASPSPGKNILPYMLTNQFGISLICTILRQVELMFPDLEPKAKADWTNFMTNFVIHMSTLPNSHLFTCPINPIPLNIVQEMLSRCGGLQIQQYALVKRTLSSLDKENS